MPRPLTEKERATLKHMLTALPAQHPAHAQIAAVQAGAACGCGTCPSIELLAGSESGTERLVIGSAAPGALLLLFVDGGRPSHLELAPVDDDVRFSEFPPMSELEPPWLEP